MKLKIFYIFAFTTLNKSTHVLTFSIERAPFDPHSHNCKSKCAGYPNPAVFNLTLWVVVGGHSPKTVVSLEARILYDTLGIVK